ncbi:MAG: hypothetical protein AB8B62_07500 [Roseobacter sp.]
MKAVRLVCFTVGAAALVACAPQVPDSARGVGFDSPQAIQARDAALQGSGARVPYTILPPEGGTGAPQPVTGTASIPGSAEATAAETARILAETRADGSQGAPTATVSTGSAANSNGISNENNFDAVSEQRSIEGDAARLAQSKAQYQVIEPQALPERSGTEQPNIVAFALSTNHPVGSSVYARAGLNGAARAERNCRSYTSPDKAQIDFLARGGPKRDRKGLDPDGDGYACGWDPSPFRKAAQG